MDYAGDVDVTETWRRLSEDPGAVLIDVRTTAEWNFVGLPDLSQLEKKVLRSEWKTFPSMVNGLLSRTHKRSVRSVVL